MKKFEFRFESLLKIREHKEKEKQRAHAEALDKVIQQKSTLTAIDRYRLETMNEQRDRLTGTLNPNLMLSYSRFLLKLKQDTLSGTEVLRGLEKTAEKKRRELVEAAKQRKIYEKLKERQREKHNQELAQAERKELDEVAMNVHRQGKRKSV